MDINHTHSFKRTFYSMAGGRARNMARLVFGLALVTLMVACSPEQKVTDGREVSADKVFRWKMVTAWPKNFPGLGRAPENFKRYVEQMSQGRLLIKLYAGGELVPALEVFDALSRGIVEMGHSGTYYDKGKIPAAQLFTSIPFGLTALEMSAWMHYGGGHELFEELYAEYNIVPFVGGNTGVQMMGWFNKEINSLEDLRGLRIRIPGVAGDVLADTGAQVVTLPAAELYTAMQTGVLDAVEWVGPYNDLAIGLHEVAKYYYYPGWHEPGSALYFGVNRKAWDSLPADLQAIVRIATRAAAADMLDEYTARNGAALKALVEQHDVQLRALPPPVLESLREASMRQMDALMKTDPRARKIYESVQKFVDEVHPWHQISEQAYMEVRK